MPCRNLKMDTVMGIRMGAIEETASVSGIHRTDPRVDSKVFFCCMYID